MRRLPFVFLVGCLTAGYSAGALAQQQPLINRWPGDPEPAASAPATPAPAAPATATPAPAARSPARQTPPPAPAAKTPAAQEASPQIAAPEQTDQEPAAAPKRAPRAAAHPAATHPKPAASPPRALACSGVFAKATSEEKLAASFGKDNVTWTQVDGPEASKLDATVIFAKDPKRRLEILWTNEEARSDVQVISINGQSGWSAPKGLHLGLTLAQLEKLNGKAFSIKGFSGEGSSLVTSWNNGALSTLPGGCKVGVRFAADPKAGPLAADIAGDKEFLSSFPALKNASPKVSEILIGY